jgi:hypothetical protein
MGGGGLTLAAALVGGGGARFRLAMPLVTAACVCVGVYFMSSATWAGDLFNLRLCGGVLHV